MLYNIFSCWMGIYALKTGTCMSDYNLQNRGGFSGKPGNIVEEYMRRERDPPAAVKVRREHYCF